MIGRRVLLIGGGGLGLALAGLGYRAWDRGVGADGVGPAYAPWRDWQGSPEDGPLRPLRAAILAANPHDTQPWAFAVGQDGIEVFADRARNLGSFDPFRREMHLGLGAAIENLTLAARAYGMNAAGRAGRRIARPLARRRAGPRGAGRPRAEPGNSRPALFGDPPPPHQPRTLPAGRVGRPGPAAPPRRYCGERRRARGLRRRGAGAP